MYILSSPAECELSHIVFNYFLQLLVVCPLRPCLQGAIGGGKWADGVDDAGDRGLRGNGLDGLWFLVILRSV